MYSCIITPGKTLSVNPKEQIFSYFSYKYPQHVFSWKNNKNIMWIPSFILRYAFHVGMSDIHFSKVILFFDCSVFELCKIEIVKSNIATKMCEYRR